MEGTGQKTWMSRDHSQWRMKSSGDALHAYPTYRGDLILCGDLKARCQFVLSGLPGLSVQVVAAALDWIPANSGCGPGKDSNTQPA